MHQCIGSKARISSCALTVLCERLSRLLLLLLLCSAAALEVRGAESGQLVQGSFSINGEQPEELDLYLSPALELLRADSRPILRALQEVVIPEILASLRLQIKEEAWVTPAALRASGVSFEFDPGEFLLNITIPPEQRAPLDVQVFGRKPPADIHEALPPENFSWFINLRPSVTYLDNERQQGFEDLQSDFEGAIHYKGFVLEGDWDYFNESQEHWERGDFRLVWDDVDRAVRYSIGDLAYPLSGLQTFRGITGVGVSRNFNLQPYRITEPLGRTSFFLRRPSRVEVLVNGSPVQSFMMPAGQHQLRDFFFVSGNNEVVLRITDDSGKVEIIQQTFFYDPNLLAQGEHEFSYNAGIASQFTAGGKEYDTEKPAASFFHRLGVLDNFTVGVNGQTTDRGRMAGVEMLWATGLGIFHLENAGSHVNGLGFDSAHRLQYDFFDSTPNSPWRGRLTMSAQYFGKNFGSLAVENPQNRIEYDLNARYSQRLPLDISAGVFGGYQFRRAPASDTSRIGLFASKRWRRDLNINISLEKRFGRSGDDEYRAFISLTWYFGKGHNTYASYDTLGQISRVEYQYAPFIPIGKFSPSLGVQHTPDYVQTFGHMRYVGYRGDFDLGHEVTTPFAFGSSVVNRTTLRTGTALVYADGRMALSRPINDSFAMVIPEKSLKKEFVGVDRINGRYHAAADIFGPAVVPDLQSYQPRRLQIEAPDAPLEEQVQASRNIVLPRYKSATAIRVGRDATIAISGTLTAIDGALIKLQGGELFSLDKPEEEAKTVFTNRDGKFYLDGLRPGRYEIRMFQDAKNKVQITIPADATGTIDAGTFRLPKKLQLQ